MAVKGLVKSFFYGLYEKYRVFLDLLKIEKSKGSKMRQNKLNSKEFNMGVKKNLDEFLGF